MPEIQARAAATTINMTWHGPVPVLPEDLAQDPALSRRTDHPTAAPTESVASAESWAGRPAARREDTVGFGTPPPVKESNKNQELTKIEQCHAEENYPVTLDVVEHA